MAHVYICFLLSNGFGHLSLFGVPSSNRPFFYSALVAQQDLKLREQTRAKTESFHRRMMKLREHSDPDLRFSTPRLFAGRTLKHNLVGVRTVYKKSESAHRLREKASKQPTKQIWGLHSHARR